VGVTGKQVLVDNSKRREWTGRFIGNDRGYEVCLIHIIKDPRAIGCPPSGAASSGIWLWP